VGEDVFVNVAGGIAVDEPAADLGIVAAVASSLRNRPIKEGTAVFGEVGLAGEVRGISQANLRVREAAQMGFTRCVVPQDNCAPGDVPAGCELVEVRTVSEALDGLMEW
jgi:DNA repair protein RadA/Sms